MSSDQLISKPTPENTTYAEYSHINKEYIAVMEEKVKPIVNECKERLPHLAYLLNLNTYEHKYIYDNDTRRGHFVDKWTAYPASCIYGGFIRSIIEGRIYDYESAVTYITSGGDIDIMMWITGKDKACREFLTPLLNDPHCFIEKTDAEYTKHKDSAQYVIWCEIDDNKFVRYDLLFSRSREMWTNNYDFTINTCVYPVPWWTKVHEHCLDHIYNRVLVANVGVSTIEEGRIGAKRLLRAHKYIERGYTVDEESFKLNIKKILGLFYEVGDEAITFRGEPFIVTEASANPMIYLRNFDNTRPTRMDSEKIMELKCEKQELTKKVFLSDPLIMQLMEGMEPVKLL